MRRIRILTLFGLLGLFTACSSMPIGTMIKMVRLNPLDMDPQQLVVAVKTPQGINVRDGDVVIDFSFRTEDPSDSFDYQFPVMVNDEYVVPENLAKNLQENESIIIMQLSEEDALTMYNAQLAVKEYRTNHDGGAGNIDLKLASACRDNDFSLGQATLNIYLKTSHEESFFLFLRNLDVNKLYDDIQSNSDRLPDCSEVS